jgi:GcrA cell cycle regulator
MERHMRGESWTVERVQLLQKLWAQGVTAAAIAARLGGLSRSAVMGKVFRLRLQTAAPVPLSRIKHNSVNSSGQVAAPARRRRGGKRARRSELPPAASAQHKTLLELTNKTCRWPHGRVGTSKFFFCGAPEADLARGVPYCAHHMRRAYPAWPAVTESPPIVPGLAPLAADRIL